MSPRLVLPAALLALPAPPASAQVSIGPNGVRAGNTVIDSRGVHAPGTEVTAGGVRTHAPRGGTVIRTNGNTRAIDCGGGSLSVDGNANHLTVANCAAVTINGNGNDLRVDFAAPGRLSLMGNHNRATYRAPRDVRVAIGNLGTRNSVTRG